MTREEKIKQIIKDKGFSLKAFAIYADIPYTTLYSMLERGIGKASVDNVIKVCRALNIQLEDLEDQPSPSPEIHTIAAHALSDLTQEEQEKLIEYAKFIKSQRKE